MSNRPTGWNRFSLANQLERIFLCVCVCVCACMYALVWCRLMESCHPLKGGLSVCTASTPLFIVCTPIFPALVSVCVCVCVCVGCVLDVCWMCVDVLALVGNDFEKHSNTPNSQYHPISPHWNQHGGVVIGWNVLLLQFFCRGDIFWHRLVSY